MITNKAKDIIDTIIAKSRLPSPVFALIRIVFVLSILVFISGLIFYYYRIFNVFSQSGYKNIDLLLFFNPRYIFFCGFNIFFYVPIGNYIDHIIPILKILLTWLISIKILTIISSNQFPPSFSLESKYNFRKDKESQDKELQKDKNQNNETEDFVFIIISIIAILINLYAQIILLFFVLFLIIILFYDVQFLFILKSLYEYIYPTIIEYSKDLAEIIRYFYYNAINNKPFDNQLYHMTAMISLITAWISFRQSNVFLIIRGAILVMSLILLIGISYKYSFCNEQNIIRFQHVKINNSILKHHSCILINNFGNGMLLFDKKKQSLFSINYKPKNVEYLTTFTSLQTLFGSLHNNNYYDLLEYEIQF